MFSQLPRGKGLYLRAAGSQSHARHRADVDELELVDAGGSVGAGIERVSVKPYFCLVEGTRGSKVPYDDLALAYAQAAVLHKQHAGHRRVLVLETLGVLDVLPKEAQNVRAV